MKRRKAPSGELCIMNWNFMESTTTLRQHANKVDGLLYDLNRVLDVMENISCADEDSPWELLYLRDETQTMLTLATKRNFIVRLIAEEATVMQKETDN